MSTTMTGKPFPSPAASCPCAPRKPRRLFAYGRTAALTLSAFIGALWACLLTMPLARAGDIDSLEPASVPSLLASLRTASAPDFCGEPVPLHIQQVREELEKELMLCIWNRPQVILWIKRSGRYMGHIEASLREHGLPEDIKYVPIIESALLPHVASSKGAVGFWQFIGGTGKRHGLRIERSVDERRNLFASTRAAVDYFKVLHERFHSWTLAAAAYNMGEEGLEAEVLAQETDDFYQLYLPLETQRYVLRLVAVKMILSDPSRYGFVLEEGDLYPPLAFQRVQVACPQEIPLLLVAKAAGTSFKNIKELNPEIRGYYLAKGEHCLLVPQGASKDFEARFQGLLQRWLTQPEGRRIYVVQPGDSLSSIAARFQVPLPALLIWNRLDPSKPIHPGDRITVNQGTRGIDDAKD